MATLTAEQLKKAIKADALEQVYLLYGKEYVLLEGCLKALVKQAVGSGPVGFNYQKFDGGKATAEEIEDAVIALPVMAPRKCVVVEDLDPDKYPAAGLDRLYKLFDDLPPTTVLIFYTTTVELLPKKKAKQKKFLAAVEKAGASVEFSEMDKPRLVKTLTAKAARSGCTLSSDAASYLIERCGTGAGALSAEIEKLCCFVGEGEITKELIDQTAVASVDASAFDLAKAVLAGGYDRAYAILSDLLFMRAEPVMILGALSSSFIDLYRAKTASLARKTAADVGKAFSYRGMDFRIRRAFSDCGKFSLIRLRACIEALAEADTKLKSSRVEGRIVLEELIGKMALAAAKDDAVYQTRRGGAF